MNFLGVGVGELLLILVIAMLVVGPERMVELSGQMGRMLAKFREQSDSITREFKEAFTLELEDGEADAAPATAAVNAASAAAAPAAPAAEADAATTDVDETAAPEEQALSPEEIAALEAVQLEQRLASDLVDGELEVALPEMGVADDGAEAEEELYEEIEAVEVALATIVPEDEEVEPTTVNEVVVVSDEDVSAEQPLEAEE
jgi:Sec-independent protein translocase protein TatA